MLQDARQQLPVTPTLCTSSATTCTASRTHLLSQKLNTGSSTKWRSTMWVKGGTTPWTEMAGKPMPCGEDMRVAQQAEVQCRC